MLHRHDDIRGPGSARPSTSGQKVSETVPFNPLVNSPLYYTAVIIDDDLVAGSVFRWASRLDFDGYMV